MQLTLRGKRFTNKVFKELEVISTLDLVNGLMELDLIMEFLPCSEKIELLNWILEWEIAYRSTP
jgi:hypothetical protein